MYIKTHLVLLIFLITAKVAGANKQLQDDVDLLKRTVSDLATRLENSMNEEMKHREDFINRVESEIRIVGQTLLNFRRRIDSFTNSIDDINTKVNNTIIELNFAKKHQQIVNWRITKLEKESNNTKSELASIDDDLRHVVTQQEETLLDVTLLRGDVQNLQTNQQDNIRKFVNIQNQIDTEKNNVNKVVHDILQIKNDIESFGEIQTSILNLTEIVNLLLKTTFPETTTIDIESSNVPGQECHKHNENVELCIHTPNCAYCEKVEFTSDRCDLPESLRTNGCTECDVLGQNEDVEIPVGSNDRKCSPLTPSQSVPLCVGKKKNVTITFKSPTATNYPIDVYLLADRMATMSLEHNPANMELLAARLQSIGIDFRLGFGNSFDKPKEPLGPIDYFAFRNGLQLTTNLNNFTVSAYSSISYGGDIPDSQLDGIFQAVACDKQIGWRKNSRKILLIAATLPYHIQGDGRAGQITKPFDGRCALNGRGFYTNEVTQDYPSVNQIVELVRKQNVNVVFAVNEAYPDSGTLEIYRALANRLTPHAYVFSAEENFSNLDDMLIQANGKMNSVVELEQIKTSDDIQVTSYSECNGKKEMKTSICRNIVNTDVTFKVEIKLLRCPSTANRNQTIKISQKGLPSSANISLRLMCNCGI